jgi:hypothetical protein
MSTKKLRSIRTWLIRNSRPLDVARWYFQFEDGKAQNVLKALAAYQNSDGGFGHGLEPDLRTPYSSPIATWSATLILREIKFPTMANQMIDKILNYLDETLIENRWPTTIPEINEAPHAPWWHFSKENEFWGWNPSVELAAFIIETGKHYPNIYSKAETIINAAMEDFMSSDYKPEVHELANFARSGEVLLAIRPDLLPEGFLNKIRQLIKETVASDPTSYQSDNYITTPSFFLNSPKSPYYPAIKEIADYYCSHLEASVHSKGYWSIPWTWGNDPIHADSLRDWKGYQILENMIYLQHFKPNSLVKSLSNS